MLAFGLSACSIDRETLRTAGKMPDESVRGFLNRAIWNDLEFGVLPFSDTVSEADPLRGSDKEASLALQIRDMRCRSWIGRKLCAFDLVRTSPVSDVNAPEALRCTAKFIYGEEDGEKQWMVARWHPRRGHSRTTMECVEI